MSRTEIKLLIDRYLKGETSADENDIVEQWLIENNNLQNPWDLLGQLGREQWLQKVFHNINSSILPEAKVVPIRKRINWKISIAAASILFFFCTILIWPNIKNFFSHQRLSVVHMNYGQKRLILLDDGSKIWINANSTFQFPKKFTDKTREVYLTGEAYFDIKHKLNRPFIVHTGKLSTIVLGTAFNINANENNHTVIVTVTRGKVSVNNGGKMLGVIIPNQQITFNTTTKEHSQLKVNSENVIAWKEENFEFDDVTFEMAVEKLEQHFQVKIRFANVNLKNCKFSGTAPKEEKLEKVLNTICSFNKSTYKYNPDGTIIISGKGCN